MRSWRVLWLFALWLATAPAFAAASPTSPAQKLLHDARRRLATGLSEQRQFARRTLEEAYVLEPENPDIGLLLGRVYLEADMLSRARDVAVELLTRNSASSDAQFLMGELWRRNWLVLAEDTFRDRAILHLARGLRIAPGDFPHYRLLVPLLVDAGETNEARNVAMLAARSNPSNPEAWLMLAYAAQQAGDVALADGMFRKAIPALGAPVRARFEDLTPLLAAHQAFAFEDMTPAVRAAHAEAYWNSADPDPVTPENEARLEFFARVTHAWLLYGMTSLGEWDMRAQLYIRYGRPAWVERNPIVNPALAMYGNWMVWTYPDLGMRVWMEARNPLSHYEAPFSAWSSSPIMPFADSLARHPELLAVSGGRALFRAIPANAAPMPLGSSLAQFETPDARHLLAQAEVFGAPGSPLTAEWAVQDSTYEVVVRSANAFGASACGAGASRSAGFTAELPPGSYRLGVHVEDGAGHVGIARRNFVVRPPSTTLSISDLVVTCGTPQIEIVPGAGVRLEPETGLLPMEGDQLNAYFEVYRLSPSTDGRADFEYQCQVRRADRDRRAWLSRVVVPRTTLPPVHMMRRESSLGDTRRQFLTIPIRELPPGRYELEVQVRDMTSGAESRSLAEFVRK